MKIKTGTARYNGHGFGGSAKRKKLAAPTNPIAHTAVKSHTAAVDSWPLGRCRIAVRGLAASKCRSARRLNAMAVLRASTMHARISPSSNHENPSGFECHASTAPIKAKGSANSVWLNRIISSSRRTFCHIGLLYQLDGGVASK